MPLPDIKSVADLHTLTQKELIFLAAEIRAHIIEVVRQNGGHLASNLGAVELTIALHRSFSSPEDAIIFDVSHQSYTHKILTGRYERFSTLRQKNGISGFTRRSESEHDAVDAGHASTSISSALGILAGNALMGKKGKAVAVIGDGALSGGIAFEALSHAGQLAENLIVVLNDNNMAISANTGSLSRYLSSLTMTTRYQGFRRKFDTAVSKLPVVSAFLTKLVFRMKRGIKGIFFATNLFSDFGFEYVGPIDGHNIAALEHVFEKVQKLAHPVCVHVVTKKGKGYEPAEIDPVAYHGVAGVTGVTPAQGRTAAEKAEKAWTFTDVFGQKLVELAETNASIAAITPAMTKGSGLSAFAQKFSERFFDVGICEQHAITFSAGLAISGGTPFTAIYSTFLQRSVDQIVEDIAISAVPVILAIDRAGAVAGDGETHQGIFDIAFLLPVPNLFFLACASKAELELCMEWAAGAKKMTAIRYPKNTVPPPSCDFSAFSLPLEIGRGVLIRQEEFASDHVDSAAVTGTSIDRTLFVFTGGMFPEALFAARSLVNDGCAIDLYNLRFLKPLDETYFISLVSEKYTTVLFIEDGVKAGGIGRFLERLVQKYCKNVATQVLGFPDAFLQQGTRDEILSEAELDSAHIIKTFERIRKQNRVDSIEFNH
ncbi:MAG: 1-deoxy-D-xylulose-5-phosphate synthase [Treponemataceae bacterium]|nr:MAG: 1-deoxy-D-xylulose-5-phosphate synthase [Treponemataceae bacterium]